MPLYTSSCYPGIPQGCSNVDVEGDVYSDFHIINNGDGAMKKVTDRQKKILAYLKSNPDRWIGAKEVGIEALGYSGELASPNTRGAMISLLVRGYLKTDFNGRYKIKEK